MKINRRQIKVNLMKREQWHGGIQSEESGGILGDVLWPRIYRGSLKKIMNNTKIEIIRDNQQIEKK